MLVPRVAWMPFAAIAPSSITTVILGTVTVQSTTTVTPNSNQLASYSPSGTSSSQEPAVSAMTQGVPYFPTHFSYYPASAPVSIPGNWQPWLPGHPYKKPHIPWQHSTSIGTVLHPSSAHTATTPHPAYPPPHHPTELPSQFPPTMPGGHSPPFLPSHTSPPGFQSGNIPEAPSRDSHGTTQIHPSSLARITKHSDDAPAPAATTGQITSTMYLTVTTSQTLPSADSSVLSSTLAVPPASTNAASTETSSQSGSSSTTYSTSYATSTASTSNGALALGPDSTPVVTVVITETVGMPPATTAPTAIASSLNAAPLNGSAVEECLVTPGGVQADNTVEAGCGAIFQHVEACYDALAPWTDPYNPIQSIKFQTCLCRTTATDQFNTSSTLWRNFTSCTNCLLTVDSGIVVDTLASEFLNIESFCRSQHPVAYLVITSFEKWLLQLNQGLTLTTPPLTGSITQIGSLQSLFTTVPPLANLAWGPSAPFDGSLAGVTPVLITQTITVPGIVHPLTKLVTVVNEWVPTAAPVGTATAPFTPASASVAAASLAASNLEGALSSLAAMGQGGPPSQVCHGKCPKSAAERLMPFTVAAGLGLTIAVLSVMLIL